MRFVVTFILAILSSLSVSLSVSAAEFKTFKDISYHHTPVSTQQILDIYVPDGVDNFARLPVHIFVHGGAWTKGDKKLKRPDIQAYTDRGVILVSLNYRLGPKHKYPDNVKDIVQASAWIRKNIRAYSGNPNRLVLSGHSAGAHLAALVGVGTPDVPAAPSGQIYKAIFSVDTASYDLTQKSEGKLSRWVNRQKRSVFGRNPAALRRASPLHQIERRARYSPMHLYVTASRPDAVQHTQNFQQALRGAGQPAHSHVMNATLSHADMRDEIFNPNSVIFKSVMRSLGR